MTAALRRLVAGAVLASLVAAMVLLLTSTASAAPAVTVAPASGLGDGQYVRVAWRGFKPAQLTYFRQCDANPAILDLDCATAYQVSGQSDGSGAGVLYLAVREGDVAAQGSGAFSCTDTSPCSIVVLTDPHDLSTGVVVPLTFAPSASSCPDPGTGNGLLGSGSSSAYRAMFAWEATVCRDPFNLPVEYTLADSVTGRMNFIAGLTDFGVTGTPFTHDERQQLFQAKQAFTYTPITSSGLVLAYKIFEQDIDRGQPGPQITDLRLTPDAVARIFTGQVDNWHLDGEINRLNPAHANRFPPLVRALTRADHSAASYEFTQWLSATAGDALPADWPGAIDTYPSGYLGVDQGITGADRLAQAIASPTENDLFQFGYIGYIDSSLADYYGLPTVKIRNAAGKYVSATPASILAALKHATHNDDGVTITPSYRTNDPAAYPLPTVNYFVTSSNNLAADKVASTVAFLRWAIHDGQAGGALPAGYVPLPKPFVADATTSIGVIADQSGKPVKPPKETTPPPSEPPPTTPPTVPPTGIGGGGTGAGIGYVPPPTTTPPGGTCPDAPTSTDTSTTPADDTADKKPDGKAHKKPGETADKDCGAGTVQPSAVVAHFPATTIAGRVALASVAALAIMAFAVGPGLMLVSGQTPAPGWLAKVLGLPR